MFATGIGLLIKGIQKMEDAMQPVHTETRVEKPKFPEDKKFGLFGKILETGKKFIKEDIKDEDFLK